MNVDLSKILLDFAKLLNNVCEWMIEENNII